jgi:glutamate synthase domain-containing protein 1
METDTEVVAYAVDLLIRRHNLPIEIAARVLASPLWTEIHRLPEREKNLYRTLRQVYGSLLLNGPFAVIIAHGNEMIGLTDRIRLRPMVVGTKDDTLFISSEEAPIHLVCPDVDETWIPRGGEPVVGTLGKPFRRMRMETKKSPELVMA